ncbi:glycine-rich RNA-binding protein 4, mitochondrial-like isoform X2 [Rosa rugosa]|uniref:glycine-rich RNA-binding protein 4, mitochondrial-like isoform X2 n=1 Tax=Rosa rugosa TaxID=74645 RepID=UPI002B4027AE|nr:glycine-rich RNA-binding protein 4, mitochondrial-like isoform X2 [Rosa rugosa]
MRGLNGGGVSIWRKWSILARNSRARHSCTKLFVGGLCYDTNEPVLKDAFGKHGEIIEVKVICDHVSGKSKGYGFVKFTSETEASTALKEMDVTGWQTDPLGICTQGVKVDWYAGVSLIMEPASSNLISFLVLAVVW